MKRLMFPISVLTLALIVSPIFAPVASKAKNDPAVAAPESVGMSSSRLANIRAVMNNHVADKRIPGASGLIARQGKIAYQETFGMADVEAGKPMKMDTIHRIYSMTKPITSVALMMLYEEGKFQLNDPVAKYLPEFARMQVAIEEKDPQTGKSVMKTVPARRQITVRDLLRHTAGLSYGVFGDTLVDREYRKAKILGQLNLAEFVTQLAAIPLLFEPGTRWHYSVSVDVQGRLIEVMSGKPFDQFLQERIFTPLEMNDTAFVVPVGKKERFARLHTITKEGRLAPSPT